MRLSFLASFCVLLLTSPNLWAAELPGQCSVRFSGQATIHNFEGTARCEPFILSVQDDPQSKTEFISAAVIRVPLASLQTENDFLNQRTYDLLEAEQYPLIEGYFAAFRPDILLQQLNRGEPINGPLNFALRIREVTRQVDARITELRQTPEEISGLVEFSISLSDFQLDPPKFLGLIRVTDEVRVTVRVVLQVGELIANLLGRD